MGKLKPFKYRPKDDFRGRSSQKAETEEEYTKRIAMAKQKRTFILKPK